MKESDLGSDCCCCWRERAHAESGGAPFVRSMEAFWRRRSQAEPPDEEEGEGLGEFVGEELEPALVKLDMMSSEASLFEDWEGVLYDELYVDLLVGMVEASVEI